MLGFGYMLLVMLIVATISIAENSRTHEGLVPSSARHRVAIGQEALDLITDS
ncbi:putative Splicing factor 3B subunit [Daphnia magna]|uniref:Putative Splicing factor 3B subunit n=1 Tax=Daphnia magna TaxID=35525 RepID=A0A162D0E5_9CRUS|nr:putative Splicing factor 3B subunit [Daphnia magna]